VNDIEITIIGSTPNSIEIQNGDVISLTVSGGVGPQGIPGKGFPEGGNENQILAKKSNINYDTQWVDNNPTVLYDNTLRILNHADNTKQIALDASSILHGGIRTIHMPNNDVDLGDIGINKKQLDYIESSGLLWGCDLSINASDPHYFDMSPGAVIIVDNYTDPENPVKIIIEFTVTQTILDPYIADADTVYFGILNTGLPYFTLDTPFTDAERRMAASIGWLDHTGRSEIEFTGMEPSMINSIASQFHDFIYAFGAFNIYGNEYSYSTGLTIKRSAGSAFCPNQNYSNEKTDPHVVTTNAENPVPIFYYYRSLTGWINNTPITGYIDPEHYDNGSGTLVTVPTGKWQIQLISYYPLWEANDIQYGQEVFDNLETAETALQSSVEINPYNSVDVFRGWLIVKQGATDLSNLSQAKFKSSGKLGMFDVQSGGGTGGEINTASNVGTTGIGFYYSKVGVNLQFKNLKENSTYLTVTDNPADKTVRVDISPTAKTVIDNTSNVNSGDETQTTIKSKLGVASAIADGYLSIANWTTFNAKLSAGASPIYATPANPTALTGFSYTMFGLGNTFKMTPLRSGKIRFCIKYIPIQSGTTQIGSHKLSYGTGTPPANAAIATGTVVGGTDQGGGGVAQVGSAAINIVRNIIVSGLTVGTQYWFDIQGLKGTGNTNIGMSNIEGTLEELPF